MFLNNVSPVALLVSEEVKGSRPLSEKMHCVPYLGLFSLVTI